MTFEINIWIVRLAEIIGVGIVLGLAVIGAVSLWHARKGFKL